jgi:hypothetical protein
VDRTPLLSAVLLLAPTFAGALSMCPQDWRAKHVANCWLHTDAITATMEDLYVHPGGWLVRGNCMDRFHWDDFLNALTAAWNKMSPSVGVGQGGCMSRYNRQKGQDWVDFTWRGPFVVTCDDQTAGDACAETSSWSMPSGGSYKLISLKKVDPCMGADSSGMPGILFHETLHALSVPKTSGHNTPDQQNQAQFIRDQVYGAEFVCFYGADPKMRKYVSYFQCDDLTDHAQNNLCNSFPATVSDVLPSGIYKKEGP